MCLLLHALLEGTHMHPVSRSVHTECVAEITAINLRSASENNSERQHWQDGNTRVRDTSSGYMTQAQGT